VIIVKLDNLRTPEDHLLKRFFPGPTLTVLIVPPCINLAILHKCETMCAPAGNLMYGQGLLSYGRFFRHQTLEEDRRAFLLSVRVFDAELALRIGAHGIDEGLGGDKE